MRVIPLIVLGIVSIVGSTVLLLNWGLGIEGAAYGVVIGAFVYNGLLIFYASRQFASMRKTAAFFISLFFCLAYFFTLTLALDRWLPDTLFAQALLRALVYMTLCLPMFWVIDRRIGFFAMALSVIKDKFFPKSIDL